MTLPVLTKPSYVIPMSVVAKDPYDGQDNY